jgi:Rrf2 family protein
MFSKTCEYAIRALIYIAQQSKDGDKVGIKRIAKEIDSPEHFIAKILQDLGKKQLVQSTKGPNGGFYLDEQTMQCSLAEIVKQVDGNKLFVGCGLGLKHCSETKPCPIHHEFKKVRGGILSMLENSKLEDFTKGLDEKLVFLKQ